MTRTRRGMTLVELLIAGSILTMLLGALGALFASSRRAYDANAGATAGAGQVQSAIQALFASSRRAYDANAGATAGAGQVQSAIQALQYDASLAGYCGVHAACDPLADAFEVALDPGDGACHTITALDVRYVEDRFTDGSPTARVVRYALDGEDRLTRSIAGAAAVPIAERIEAFEFCGYRARSDAAGALRFSRPAAGDLLGVEFRLVYGRGAVSSATERFAVALPNVP